MKWVEIWGRITPPRLTVYADFIDPFCYIGFHNAMQAAEGAGIPLEWRGFELNPSTPKEGSLLQTAANSDLRPGMWSSVQNFATNSGLFLTPPTRVPNTQLAHLWVQTIRETRVKNILIERIFQAYLSDNNDVGDVAVLTKLALEWGLSIDPFMLAGKHPPNPLEQFRQEALDHGFPGMPGFIYRGKSYFGALSAEAWKDILNENLTSARFA